MSAESPCGVVPVTRSAWAAFVLVAALVLAGCQRSPQSGRGAIDRAAGFQVRGASIIGPNGRPFLAHGVDRPSLEWNPQGEHLSLADFQRMAAWGANTVRLSLNQDFWLSTSCQYAPGYAARVRQAVAWARQAGITVVILDLHWSDRGADQDGPCTVTPAQQPMADANSLSFWRQVATTFRNDPYVWFELYNEPHSIPWSTWRNGGVVTTDGASWRAAGMQQLYDAVRSTGARNLVLVGGLGWAGTLAGGLPTYALTGFNVAYTVHAYYHGSGSTDPISAWEGAFGFAAARYPVVATEFGTTNCSATFVRNFIAYANAHAVGWTAWAWYPGGCGFPSLISNWSGTPTRMGLAVRQALLAASRRA